MRTISTAILATALLAGAPVSTAWAGDSAAAEAAYNHDMSAYKAIAQAALQAAKDGKFDIVEKKAGELETAWDNGTKDLKSANKSLWKEIDRQMDMTIKVCEGKNGSRQITEITAFIEKLNKVPAR